MTARTEYTRLRAATVIESADELRGQLDALNEAGIDHRLSGIDDNGQPFLAALAGCYADTVDVIFLSPWDGEVSHGNGQRCDDCGAANLHGLEHIAYPATVLGVVVPAPESERV